jgi:hypothetical protein
VSDVRLPLAASLVDLFADPFPFVFHPLTPILNKFENDQLDLSCCPGLLDDEGGFALFDCWF